MIFLNFDGACQPKNPGGIATYGFLVQREDYEILQEGMGFVASGNGATNNLAEWTALGKGLRWLLDNRDLIGDESLCIFGDSQLVIKQLNGEWGCRKPHLQKLKARCQEILEQLDLAWEANWVPRDSNQHADSLSQLAYQEVTKK